MIKRFNQLIKNSVQFNKTHPNSIKNPGFLILVALFLATLTFAYSNHFSNSFHFDDVHTIENNTAIQEINIKRFFSDATSFSSLPGNQSYRPFTTLENAIDYKIGNGLNSKIFHIHIFFLVFNTNNLTFLLYKKIT